MESEAEFGDVKYFQPERLSWLRHLASETTQFVETQFVETLGLTNNSVG